MKPIVITSRVTNRETESFEIYLKEIAQIPVFTPEEEAKCALKASLGDERAREELVTKNLRFVVTVAKQYANQFNQLEDLVNEGNIGLIKAAEKFSPEMGFKFISYGVWWIRKIILEYLAKNGRLVRLPANKINDLSKLDKKVSELEQLHGRNIDIQEIMVDLDTDEISTLGMLNSYGTDSLDREINGEESSYTLADLLVDTETYQTTDHLVLNGDINLSITKVLKTLKPREKDVICSIYGLEGQSRKTLNEIGDDFGVTREMIRQIKDKALAKLKTKLYRSGIAMDYGSFNSQVLK